MIAASGRALLFNNQKYIPLGLNYYNLAQGTANLTEYFSSLPPYCLTRFWCTQTATQPASGPWTSPNWTNLENVFETAASFRQLLFCSLAVWAQPYEDTASAVGAEPWVSGGTYTTPTWVTYGADYYFCTANVSGSTTAPPSDPTHWHPYRQGQAYFNGGYSSVIPGQAAPLSYEAWLTAFLSQEFVTSSPALGMVELMSEPEVDDAGGNTPEAVDALLNFFTNMGGLAHELVGGILVSSGVIGGGQDGVGATSYATIHASSGIDVCSYHDYDPGLNPIAYPTDSYNGMAVRIAQASALDKPLVVGECGIWVSATPPAETPWASTDAARAAYFSSFYAAQTAAGIAGLLLWDLQPDSPAGYDIGFNDPSLNLLIGESDVAGTVSINGQLTGLPEGNVQIGPMTLTPSASALSSGDTFQPTSGLNEFVVPAWASLMLIIPSPENTQSITLKGGTTDTGIGISPTQPTLIALPPSPPGFYYLTAGGNFTTWLSVKFY